MLCRIPYLPFHSTYDPPFETFSSIDKAQIIDIESGSLDGVAGSIRKNGDAFCQFIAVGHIRRVSPFGHDRWQGVPGLPVQDIGFAVVKVVEHGPDLVHGLNIMDAHQIKAETVDMIFLSPVADGIQHIKPHHAAVAGRFTAAAAGVGKAAVRHGAVIIIGHGQMLKRFIRIIGMIVDHVQDDADACPVQGQDHLLHLPYPFCPVIRIRRVRPLRAIVIKGIIAPVVGIAVYVVCRLRCIIRTGQQMNVRNAQLF